MAQFVATKWLLLSMVLAASAMMSHAARTVDPGSVANPRPHVEAFWPRRRLHTCAAGCSDTTSGCWSTTCSRKVSSTTGSLDMFASPCSRDTKLTTLTSCQPITYLGDKRESTCSEGGCYAKVTANGKTGWVWLQSCSGGTITIVDASNTQCSSVLPTCTSFQTYCQNCGTDGNRLTCVAPGGFQCRDAASGYTINLCSSLAPDAANADSSPCPNYITYSGLRYFYYTRGAAVPPASTGSSTCGAFCTAVSGSSYDFFSHQDSSGGDMFQWIGSAKQLAAKCSSTAGCVGFTSAGWLKSSVKPPAQRTMRGSAVCDGLWMSRSYAYNCPSGCKACQRCDTSTGTCVADAAKNGQPASCGAGQVCSNGACSTVSCDCSSSAAGLRLLLGSSAPLLNQPCAALGAAATLAKCELWEFSGTQRVSSCAGEAPTCYAAVSRGGSTYWVANHACAAGGSNIGMPHNTNCANCAACTGSYSLPSGDNGQRLVILDGGVTARAQTCASSASVGTAAKCAAVTWTGYRAGSNCGDGWCYAQVRLALGAVGWVPLSKCDGSAIVPGLTATLGMSNTAACTSAKTCTGCNACQRCDTSTGTCVADAAKNGQPASCGAGQVCSNGACSTAPLNCTAQGKTACGNNCCSSGQTCSNGMTACGSGCCSAGQTCSNGACTTPPTGSDWSIPSQAPSLKGTTAFDKAVATLLAGINAAVPKQASIYYARAVEIGKLPTKFKAGTRVGSVRLISKALLWDDAKLAKLWSQCSALSSRLNVRLDPRLMLAIIKQEGTGSFDTNSVVRAGDGGSGVQPDFDADLAAALEGHVMGKFFAYSFYASQYQAAAAAARASTARYSVCGPTRAKLAFTGSGDFFDYVNYDTPMLKPKSAGGFSWARGPYACDYQWARGIRRIFESLAGSDSALAYSRFIAAQRMPWPASVNGGKPKTVDFLVRAIATDSTGKWGGYPALVQQGGGRCGGKLC